MKRILVVVLAALACTSSQKSSPDLSQVVSFDQTASTASAVVAQYGQAATSATTRAECTAALERYVGQMQPLLQQLRSMSARMDDFMMGSGAPVAADVTCGMQVMSDELSHHQGVACASADMAANRDEARRHAEAMESFAEHMEMRAVQAGGMMSQGGMMGGGQGQMMDGGWMTGRTDGGWMLPDGGVMSFDQPMPGCTHSPGGYQPADGGDSADGGSLMDGGMR